MTEPQRFQPQLRSGEFVNRVASRTIDREEKRGAQVKFKSAEVKQLSSMDVLQVGSIYLSIYLSISLSV